MRSLLLTAALFSASFATAAEVFTEGPAQGKKMARVLRSD